MSERVKRSKSAPGGLCGKPGRVIAKKAQSRRTRVPAEKAERSQSASVHDRAALRIVKGKSEDGKKEQKAQERTARHSKVATKRKKQRTSSFLVLTAKGKRELTSSRLR